MCDNQECKYIITGKAGHERLCPLLPLHWKDVTLTSRQDLFVDDQNEEDCSEQIGASPDFVWENQYNARATRVYRDQLKCYSHLPNGCLLDDKWALARLSQQSTSKPFLLESHCFVGKDGFQNFIAKVGLLTELGSLIQKKTTESKNPSFVKLHEISRILNNKKERHVEGDILKDLVEEENHPDQIWVIKDASSNGAGGIWFVCKDTINEFLQSCPLISGHRYVAQHYVYPPLLYSGRKFHVRAYAIITCHSEIYLHGLGFLHVANQPFSRDSNGYEPEVHITNCCANSHDDTKFTGEIVAKMFDSTSFSLSDLDQRQKLDGLDQGQELDDLDQGQELVDLSPFLPSIIENLQWILESFHPFVKGGTHIRAFQYLGLDFMLTLQNHGNLSKMPCAHLLEINAPPSQDTATGLHHAEFVHNKVIQDWIDFWVVPSVARDYQEYKGLNGWKRVHAISNQDQSHANTEESYTRKSFHKQAMWNKLRWKLFETKCSNQEKQLLSEKQSGILDTRENIVFPKPSLIVAIETTTPETKLIELVRNSFPFYALSSNPPIFFENGGGSQVPQQVIEAMTHALTIRDRSTIGSEFKNSARDVLLSMLGAEPQTCRLFMGSNATELLATLARNFSMMLRSRPGAEIVIAEHNHEANVIPWLNLAAEVGAKVRWWKLGDQIQHLKAVLNSNTVIVAMAHASNILGHLYDIELVSHIVKSINKECHLVVDGVAAVPHRPARFTKSGADWYVASCHKWFGPHLGVLCGKTQSIKALACQNTVSDFMEFEQWEHGTINVEACAGVQGMSRYFNSLSTLNQQQSQDSSVARIEDAYSKIALLEYGPARELRSFLKLNPSIQVLEELCVDNNSQNLPLISFSHKSLSSLQICHYCRAHNVSCRSGVFLSNRILTDFGIQKSQEGVCRFSLAHYNTLDEVIAVQRVLSSMPGWIS